MRYSAKFVEKMVEKMTGPGAKTATALSKEAGVSQSTLSQWLREAKLPAMTKKSSEGSGASGSRGRRRRWSGDDKIRVVTDAARLDDDSLGGLLRREGLHMADLERFREEVREAAREGFRAKGRRGLSPAQKQVRALQKELRRKERALAETAALLVLRGKVQAFFLEGEEGDTDHGPEQRVMVLGWLDEAQAAGARLEPACQELNLDPRTVQRWRARDGGEDLRHGPRTTPHNKLSATERQDVLDAANSAEFRDFSPKQIVPKLADEGRYVASESTFYRILREEKMLSHRGRALAPSSRPPAQKRANGPGQVWSWDITYLRSSVTGVFFYLYMFVDVWSRKVVAFDVHEEENSEHASKLLVQALEDEDIDDVQLALHSDNGAPMKGATIKATMERLGVLPSYSRPNVSDDNPFSESLFRTMKYRPNYPKKPFESCAMALGWAVGFVRWYHHDHLHSGIGFVTPLDRHEGRADAMLEARKQVSEAAKRRHPERWTSGRIRAWNQPGDVLLNPTKDTRLDDTGHAIAA